MPSATAQIQTTLEADCLEAVAEEVRAHDDVIDQGEFELAPCFVPEDLDFSEYRWGRGDHRLERDLQMYEAGHSARDFR